MDEEVWLGANKTLLAEGRIQPRSEPVLGCKGITSKFFQLLAGFSSGESQGRGLAVRVTHAAQPSGVHLRGPRAPASGPQAAPPAGLCSPLLFRPRRTAFALWKRMGVGGAKRVSSPVFAERQPAVPTANSGTLRSAFLADT